MKRYVSLLAIGIALCGCDGHVSSFNPIPTTGKTAAEVAADKQKLVDAVTAVATQRGYERWDPTPDSGTVLQFSKELNRRRGRMEISVFADNKSGEYHVSLLDWPSTARSAESTEAEAAIRKELSAH